MKLYAERGSPKYEEGGAALARAVSDRRLAASPVLRGDLDEPRELRTTDDVDDDLLGRTAQPGGWVVLSTEGFYPSSLASITARRSSSHRRSARVAA